MDVAGVNTNVNYHYLLQYARLYVCNFNSIYIVKNILFTIADFGRISSHTQIYFQKLICETIDTYVLYICRICQSVKLIFLYVLTQIVFLHNNADKISVFCVASHMHRYRIKLFFNQHELFY